ncbi:MAG: hypothetical protein VB957_04450 [Pseudomonadales bacterium]|jgi:hypothetical protein
MRELSYDEIGSVSGGLTAIDFAGIAFPGIAGLATSAITGAVWGVRFGGLAGAAAAGLVSVGWSMITVTEIAPGSGSGAGSLGGAKEDEDS